jgi:ABC-type lipoprotein export system ATPase subunit
MEGVLRIFMDLKEEGKTLVISTNDPFMTDFGDKTIKLTDGEIVSL